MTDEMKLAPCPDCGHKVIIIAKRREWGGENDYFVDCTHCSCRSGLYETRAEVAAAWNRRAERDLAAAFEGIANLALEGALTDGAHHKQWYIERIMVECGAPVQAWHKRHQWAVGIAP